ncbi:hypothetical protein LC087_02635 [Bacillus carboniphilus]|uniref:Uncharacterized protein n=1 Tax=Bacillus carboniphilus TaxID=86663 RepID=A0ABY9JX93_9BACI|nr:hypothetical protein [Bacillus carboniphilus]WLR43123.1 hypothetical protein LC087_02635 [Bacillus carboniphilus]
MARVVFCGGPIPNPSNNFDEIDVLVRNTDPAQSATVVVRFYDLGVANNTVETLVASQSSTITPQNSDSYQFTNPMSLTNFAVDVRVDMNRSEEVIATAVMPSFTLLSSGDTVFEQFDRQFICRPRGQLEVDFGS